MKNLYVILTLLFFTTISSAQTLESDRDALMALFNASGGNSSWAVKTGWGQPGSPCGWFGVTCENDRVVKLDMPDNFLSGTLPPEIGNLTALTFLNLEGEGWEFRPLGGKLPSELGNLTNLEFLNLADNSFDVSSDFGIFGALTKLKVLAFTPNSTLPEKFAALIDLEELHLFSSDVFGTPGIGPLPAFIKDFTKLKNLVIFNAGITGVLPAELGTLSNLERLIIRNNPHLNAANIPATLPNLQKLKYLDLSQSNLTGDIPTALGSLINLTHIDFSQNDLTGTIPSSFANLVNLEFLDLHYNNLTGTFSSLSKLNKLTTLDLSYNSLSGKVPDLSAIEISSNVYINNNQFTFDGMENNVSRLDRYQHQVTLKLTGVFALRTTAPLPGMFEVLDAYETRANNTYKWYIDNSLILTGIGKYQCSPAGLGAYRVEVTNSFVPGLTLVSEEYVADRIILPVTLISFSGENKSDGTALTWKTSLEINNKGFEIERSSDAKTFETIGFIDGNGDTNENKTYEFLDSKPFAKTYYRLKQIDWDGKFDYSRIISVKKDKAQLSVYPNPATKEIFVSGLDQEENIQIRNSMGRIILEQKINTAQPLNTSQLSNGLYLIKVGEETKKVVIQN